MGSILSSRSSHSSPRAKNGLIYSFVARGPGPQVVVLAEYTPVKGNFKKIALECAQTLDANNHSVTYTRDSHTFNFLVEDGFAYLVVAEESLRWIPFAFLALVKDDFREKFPGAYKDKANSLNKRFRPIMKKHMTFCVNRPEELDKVANIQNQLDEMKGIAWRHINKFMDHQERLEDVFKKSGSLVNEAQHFQRRTNRLKIYLCCQSMKVKLIVLLLIVLLAVVLWLFICLDGSGNNTPACNQAHLVINLGFRFLKSCIDFL
uniref:Vesicle-associated membrane protein 72C n=1 Tax=Marchantia polymorpha TaxID=3197 RepID=A0A0H5BQN7_MARPO|nr:vesicle-associated membrane protein 72C [Marchantia polymorpha]